MTPRYTGSNLADSLLRLPCSRSLLPCRRDFGIAVQQQGWRWPDRMRTVRRQVPCVIFPNAYRCDMMLIFDMQRTPALPRLVSITAGTSSVAHVHRDTRAAPYTAPRLGGASSRHTSASMSGTTSRAAAAALRTTPRSVSVRSTEAAIVVPSPTSTA